MEPKRFYGRRIGKRLKPRRKALLETLLPKLQIDLPEQGGELDLSTLFPFGSGEYRLEIGFGGGEHLAALAERHPDIGFIGCEVFINGIAAFLSLAEEKDLRNVRLWPEDVRDLLPALPEACFSRIDLLFPDPWPKSRHAERRFVSAENLTALARVLKIGGELLIASDHPTYQRWTLRHAPLHEAFRWRAEGPSDWLTPPEGWPGTRYEAKAIKEGRIPMFLRFERVG